MKQKKEALGISACYYDNDYFAAAAEKCGGVQNLPTEDDLYELAKKVYPSCNDITKECTGAADLSQLPEGLSGLGSSWYRLSSSNERNEDHAYSRGFEISGSYRGYYNRQKGSSFTTVCVGGLE